MADALFEERRLAQLDDALDDDRTDLEAYLALAEELDAHSVLDIGCGTGTLACLLAQRGMDVTGIDPAAASLEVARRKPYADCVRWLTGDVSVLPPLRVDLVTMTGNVAKVFLDDQDWASTLRAACAGLRPNGYLVFEVRDPAREAWREWTREKSYRRLEPRGAGSVEAWVELADVSVPLISFRWTFVFDDGVVLTSNSTLRFRPEAEISAALRTAGFTVVDVRDAPDRPGRELVFLAKRAGVSAGDGSGRLN